MLKYSVPASVSEEIVESNESLPEPARLKFQKECQKMAVEVYQLQLIIQLLPAGDGSNSLKSAIFPTVQNNSLIIGYYLHN